MSNRLTIAWVALLAFIGTNGAASAHGVGFGAGGFHHSGVFHRGFAGRFHTGFFHVRGFVHEPAPPRVSGSFLRGGFTNEVENGLTATGLGLLIEARIASYLALLNQYSGEAGGSGGGGAGCDAQCLSNRYLKNTESSSSSSSSQAKGGDIPQYDVNHNCTALQGIPTRNYCLRTEQENYDTIKSLWSNVPGHVKDRTLAKMQDLTRGQSAVTYPYTMMKAYLVAYLQADELTRPAEPFHY